MSISFALMDVEQLPSGTTFDTAMDKAIREVLSYGFARLPDKHPSHTDFFV